MVRYAELGQRVCAPAQGSRGQAFGTDQAYL